MTQPFFDRGQYLEDMENAVQSALLRNGSHDRPSKETIEMFNRLLEKIDALDKKYAKIIVERIVFAMIAFVGFAVLTKLLLTINL